MGHHPCDFIPLTINAISQFTARGAFAPLTSTGTLLVDGIVASCYASTNWDLDLVHKAFAPVQLAYEWFGIDLGQTESGVHRYAGALMSVQSALSAAEKLIK